MEEIVVSAPGKVLIAGGYLVLDPAYSGLVISTTSKFYTVIRTLKPESTAASPVAPPPLVRVRSPQFVDAEWRYGVQIGGGASGVDVRPLESTGGSNKFVHIALQQTLQLVLESVAPENVRSILGAGLDVTIVGDNDFYSQRKQLEARALPPTTASLAQLPRFLPTGVPIREVHKTGMGSSAALITSLVCALLLRFGVVARAALVQGAGGGANANANANAGDEEGRRLAHNLAQYVHCLAQGKVGSGFDVSSAIFGSHIYTRFDPSVIQGLMSDEGTPVSLGPVLAPSNPGWNHKIEPFALPPLTRIVLADVDAGSDTPSLVGKVLKWRQEHAQEADRQWSELRNANAEVAAVVQRLHDLYGAGPEVYADGVRTAVATSAKHWMSDSSEVVRLLGSLHAATERVRKGMKGMGESVGVPIEPDEQTRLLDACIQRAGVIGGGVPGAGGYDAIWLLILDPEKETRANDVVHSIEGVWRGWTELNVSPLLASESLEKGARLEKSVADVDQLATVFS